MNITTAIKYTILMLVNALLNVNIICLLTHGFTQIVVCSDI